jgi:DNA invertase Pin-like site-specific DNA recombinase
VITYDLARISRDAAGVADFHALCTSHGTTLHTVTNGPATAAALPLLASSG